MRTTTWASHCSRAKVGAWDSGTGKCLGKWAAESRGQRCEWPTIPLPTVHFSLPPPPPSRRLPFKDLLFFFEHFRRRLEVGMGVTNTFSLQSKSHGKSSGDESVEVAILDLPVQTERWTCSLDMVGIDPTHTQRQEGRRFETRMTMTATTGFSCDCLQRLSPYQPPSATPTLHSIKDGIHKPSSLARASQELCDVASRGESCVAETSQTLEVHGMAPTRFQSWGGGRVRLIITPWPHRQGVPLGHEHPTVMTGSPRKTWTERSRSGALFQPSLNQRCIFVIEKYIYIQKMWLVIRIGRKITSILSLLSLSPLQALTHMYLSFLSFPENDSSCCYTELCYLSLNTRKLKLSVFPSYR